MTDEGLCKLKELNELTELRIGNLAIQLVGNNDGISENVFTEVLLNLKAADDIRHDTAEGKEAEHR